jgi:UDP-glucuronate 4-epimerase
MRALVPGCAGFVGSHLTEALLEDGDSVLGVDCFNDNYARPEKLRNLERARDWDGFEFVPIDLSRGDLEDEVAECDVVFHLAAEPGVRASWGSRFDCYLRNNVLATQHLLEAAKEWPEKRFVFASSSSIYGQAEKLPTREGDTPQPFSPYGTTKLAAEHLCQLYHGNFGVQTVILRYFSVFGPRQRPDMAFTIFSRAALHGGAIAVFGDGRQTRDFTYVGDVVTATRAAVHAAPAVGGVYNIGGGSQISIVDALSLIQQFAERPLEITHVPPQEGDVRNTGADTARARAQLGYRPRTDFEEGLRAQFDWVLANEEARDRAGR